MSRRILVLNAGSSSLKFAVYSEASGEVSDLHLSGAVSRLPGAPQLKVKDGAGAVLTDEVWDGADGKVDAALARLLRWLADAGETPDAVGHRIVHGGLQFRAPARLDADAMQTLRTLCPLAPLHQPFNLKAVDAARAAFPDAVQVGAFDTAFHADQPRLARLYALPRELTEEGVLAYGFHGLSYDYIASMLRERQGPAAGGRVIVAHLGSGVSLCALKNGRSIATTMGFSALDGPPMGTRSGSLDPGVLLYLMETKGLSAADLTDLLYRRSGLLGVSGESSDVQVLLDSDSPEAREALELFAYRVAEEIGRLAAVLGGLDRIVFTAGVGENAAPVRADILRRCAWLGCELDEAANAAGVGQISQLESQVVAEVIATDEQIVLARAAASLLD